MKKMILLPIVILILIFGTITNVNAITIDYDNITYNGTAWTNNNTYFFIDITQKGTNTFSLPFNNVMTTNTYDYLLINTSVELYNTYKNITISLNNINWTQTCNANTTTYDPNNYATIYYQDGSTASVEFPGVTSYCSTYNLTSGIQTGTLTEDIVDLNPSLALRIRYTDNTTTWCNQQSGAIYTCMINSGKNVKQLDYMLTNSGKSATYRIKTYVAVNKIIGQEKEVITTINNQSSQQHNDITDLNNNITSDNISGNNSSDSISSISNTFSSSNDFILNLFTLPYNFITTIMNGVTDSCTPISLGTIFDYELIMPCINLNNWLGNVWTSIVDVVLAGMLSFAFRKRIHDFFFAIIRLDRNAANIGGVDIL